MDAPAGVVHLRPRDGRDQPTTAIELFFDLVFVFAVTQLSHRLIAHLTLDEAARTAFLLLVVWWGWVNTTWMVNWFDPGSAPVRLVLVAGMLASLVLAAAVPEAFGDHAGVFAGGYVALQVGRNATGTLLLPRDHRLRPTFEHLTAWSALGATLWVAGALADHGARPAVWGAALAVDLLAPALGYRLPGRGVIRTGAWDVDGGHFAERCQGFVIIALGESIVVTGATASGADLTGVALLALGAAFAQTAALWWLYFGEVADHSRAAIAGSADAGRLARDAYTYGHVPIVAGVILAAVGNDRLVADASARLDTAAVLAALGGPALFLAGESAFRWSMVRTVNPKRLLAVAGLVALGPLAAVASALALGWVVAALLVALAVWEHHRGIAGLPRRETAPASSG